MAQKVQGHNRFLIMASIKISSDFEEILKQPKSPVKAIGLGPLLKCIFWLHSIWCRLEDLCAKHTILYVFYTYI